MNAITHTSKSLTLEADTIHAMHCDVKQHLANATLIAVQIGHRLNAVKASLPHGEFTPWVKGSFDFTTRTAQTYMKAASNYPLNSNGEIGQRDRKEIAGKSIKELAAPKAKPKAKNEVASDLAKPVSPAVAELIAAYKCLSGEDKASFKSLMDSGKMIRSLPISNEQKASMLKLLVKPAKR